MTEDRPDPSTWVDRYGDVLFRYAVARVRDTTLAEDLVQDTFLAGIAAIDTFAQHSTERTWLVGILRHKIVDHIRRASRARRTVDDQRDAAESHRNFDQQGRWNHAIEPWSSPEKSLEQTQFWKVFDECVDELPQNLRTPFALREIGGLDSDALAEVLDTTKNNLWVLLSRARQRLRRCLEVLWFAKESQ